MKAQQWAIEAMIAMSIFVVVFVLVLTFISSNPQNPQKKLELDSVAIFDEVSSQQGFVEDAELNLTEFINWFNETEDNGSLNEFKENLGIRGDFCIFLEDENGDIIRVQHNDTHGFAGVGDTSVTLGDVNCGDNVEWS